MAFDLGILCMTLYRISNANRCNIGPQQPSCSALCSPEARGVSSCASGKCRYIPSEKLSLPFAIMIQVLSLRINGLGVCLWLKMKFKWKLAGQKRI